MVSPAARPKNDLLRRLCFIRRRRALACRAVLSGQLGRLRRLDSALIAPREICFAFRREFWGGLLALLVYQGAENDPTSNISLVEVIDGVGCIARDSIQDIGTDILFLSDTGVRSLGRIIQEKSAPIFDASKKVETYEPVIAAPSAKVQVPEHSVLVWLVSRTR